jgi:hypothetical protein
MKTGWTDRNGKEILLGSNLMLVTHNRFDKRERRGYHPRVVEWDETKKEFVIAKKHNGKTFAYHKVTPNKKGKIADLEIIESHIHNEITKSF